MAELTSAGLAIRTQAEIQAEMETAQRANISDRLDLETFFPFGQLNRLISRAQRTVEEALQAVYAAIDPDGATGEALDRISAITGTIREAATSTRSTVVVNVDPGTYAIGTLAASVTGRPAARFLNAEAVVNGGGSAADVSAVFEAEDTGAVSCPQDTLVIAGPVSGWNGITSNTEGALGSPSESDAALRLRRRQEVESPGSASVDGIVADLSRNIPEIQSVSLIENYNDTTVDGIPPHSFEVVVFGPEVPTAADDQAVADQIFASKAVGVGAYGTTLETVTDSEGVSHTIGFTRPAVVDLTIALSVDVGPDYAGDSELASAIAEAADLAYVPGLNGAGSQIAWWAHAVAGVLRVTSVTINGGGSFGTYAISSRQIARIQSGSVTVTSTEATP